MNRKLLLSGIVILMFFVGISVHAQDEFVFGVVLVGPKNDSGWSQAHYEAGVRVEKAIAGSKMLLFESLNPADNPQTTLLDVATEMAGQGAQVIFTTSDEFEEDTSAVAAQLPDVTFINVTGSAVLEGSDEPNLGNFNGIGEMAQEIAGCAAALTTQTGKIGYEGPLINFETRRLAASAYLGAKFCWENYRNQTEPLSFTITWIGFWFNIPGVTLDPTEEANSLFNLGNDVVFSSIDTGEPVKVAEGRQLEGENVFAIAYDNREACKLLAGKAPRACVGVPYYNWFPAYLDTAIKVKDGTWTPSWRWIPPTYGDMANEDTSIVGFAEGEGLTPKNSALLQEFIAIQAEYGMTHPSDQSLFLWQGPLKFQDGTILAEEGESVPPYRKLAEGVSVWYLPQLLEGMTGASQAN